MPRKKVVTVERLNEEIDKAKRVKRLQAGRFVKATRSDGQPIYHYPKITLALLSKKFGVSSNYLTILRRKDEAVKKALQNVGQIHGSYDEDEIVDEPRVGTKKYVELQNKRLREELDKANKKIHNHRERNLAFIEAEQQIEQLIQSSDELRERNDNQKRIIQELEAENRSLKMKVATLENRLKLEG